MAQLQVCRQHHCCGSESRAVSLVGNDDAFFLTSDPDAPVATSEGRQPLQTVGYIFRHPDANGGESWRLFAADCRIRLNGRLLPIGVQVLRSNDEIRIGESRLVFVDDVPAPGSAVALVDVRKE